MWEIFLSASFEFKKDRRKSVFLSGGRGGTRTLKPYSGSGF